MEPFCKNIFNIVEIGLEIEKKFLYEAQLDKETALAHQRKDILDSFRDRVIEEIKDVEARERAACQREIERLNAEFENTLIEELNKLGKFFFLLFIFK